MSRAPGGSAALQRLLRRFRFVYRFHLGLIGLLDDEIAQNQGVHLALGEGTVSVGRSVYDGLAFEIERGVEYRRHASRLAEALDQLVVPRITVPEDRLQAAGAVHMSDGGQDAVFVGPH